MDRTEVIKKFNEILTSFLNQVSPLIGTKYYNKFTKLVKFNSLLPIQRFCQYGLKHKDEIMKKNPDYFLNENTYKEDVESHYGDESEQYLNEILQLKQVYISVDEISRENLWHIIQALVLLAEEYYRQTK
jgi:hypothetical protein